MTWRLVLIMVKDDKCYLISSTALVHAQKNVKVASFVLFLFFIKKHIFCYWRGASIRDVQAITPNASMHEIPAGCYW